MGTGWAMVFLTLLLSALDTQNGSTKDQEYSGLKLSLGVRRTTACPWPGSVYFGYS